MAVTTVDGGSTGGIQRVIDDLGTIWFNKPAGTSSTVAITKSGWSALGHVTKFRGITENDGKTTGER